MGILSSILDKFRHHGRQEAQPEASPRQSPSAPATNPTAQVNAQAMPSAQSGTQPRLQNVDIEAVLSKLAANKGGGGNYKQSIVDLLKLLDLDSSLSARTELANELNVHAGAHGSAEQNIALHKAVMQKLAENGGKVPESVRS